MLIFAVQGLMRDLKQGKIILTLTLNTGWIDHIPMSRKHKLGISHTRNNPSVFEFNLMLYK